MTELLAFLIFPTALVVAGAWGLFLTRRLPEQATAEDEKTLRESRAMYKDLAHRIEVAEGRLQSASVSTENSSPRVIVVRNTKAGHIRGAYRRTARTLAHRVPAE